MKPANLPPLFIARLEKQFGVSAAKNIITAFGEKRLPTFRVNTLKTTDEAVMAVLREENVAYERLKDIPHAFRIKNRSDEELLEHRLCREGKIYLQGISSMLPVLVLDPKPNEAILDLCAAPGSKTSQIAAYLTPTPLSFARRGEILACEENEVRFQKLQNTMRIQGADFVETKLMDASLLYKEKPEAFDKILADVPCSAEGRVNTHEARSYSFWSEKNIIAHAKIQRRLLRSAVACLKPGGVLVYSTCTLAPEEDSEMIEWLLATYPELKTESFKLPFVSTRPGPVNTQYVLPTKDNEGLFVAKVRKI
ncbi:MAG: RsmB/NOP family class I SAM-dependent RNA methyltransferase [Patescibacteria group bacterium]|jgi:16S rRNA C967 or C1407 C5-methylase (RsmB/RsmF family)